MRLRNHATGCAPSRSSVANLEAQQRISDLEAQLAAKDAEIAAKDARIRELEQQVAALMEQVAALTKHVATLTEKLAESSRDSHRPPSSDPPGRRVR